ncbi:MAG: hypothetical protein U1E37_13395 [Sphingomonadaceae bacterium]
MPKTRAASFTETAKISTEFLLFAVTRQEGPRDSLKVEDCSHGYFLGFFAVRRCCFVVDHGVKAVAFDAQTVFALNRCQASALTGNWRSALGCLNVKQFGVASGGDRNAAGIEVRHLERLIGTISAPARI